MKKISILSTTPFWTGGIDPEKGHRIRIDMEETSRGIDSLVYRITDTVVEEVTFDYTFTNDLSEEETEERVYNMDLVNIRTRSIQVSSDEYISLFVGADAYIDVHYPNTTIFERGALRPKIALLLFVRNDKLDLSDKCIYGTQPEDWDIIS